MVSEELLMTGYKVIYIIEDSLFLLIIIVQT